MERGLRPLCCETYTSGREPDLPICVNNLSTLSPDSRSCETQIRRQALAQVSNQYYIYSCEHRLLVTPFVRRHPRGHEQATVIGRFDDLFAGPGFQEEHSQFHKSGHRSPATFMGILEMMSLEQLSTQVEAENIPALPGTVPPRTIGSRSALKSGKN